MDLNNHIDTERLVHSIKTAIACLIGFAAISVTHFQVSQWLLITIFVVMCAQINLGGVIQKSYMRFLGTLTGSAIALSTIWIFGDNTAAFYVVILLSVLLYSYIATSDKSYSDSGTLGAVTVAIILINQHPTIRMGLERCFEISLGIIIATFVAQFLLPIRAQNHLRRNQAMTLRQLRDYYIDLLKGLSNTELTEAQIVTDEEIIKSLTAQRKLASEARRESFTKTFNIDHFKESLWCEKEILRCTAFMAHAYQACDKGKIILNNITALPQFHQDVCIALEKIAECIETKKSQVIVIPNIAAIKNESSSAMHDISENEKINLDGYLFCAQLLTSRLAKLIDLVKSIA